MQPFAARLAYILIFLCATALSLQSIIEPDLWWQLATGKQILQNLKIPTHDSFSFTYDGTLWINIKWGSELLMALVEQILGPECVPLIQTLVWGGILIFVILYINYFIKAHSIEHYKTPVLLIILSLCLLSISYRMNARPEMFTHLFTIAFIYLLKARIKNKSTLLLIFILQVCWTNLHEAFGMGVVICGIYTLGYLADYLIRKEQYILKAFIHSCIATFTAFVAIAINPYGTKMYAQIYEIYSQLGSNKFTTELEPYTSYFYWKWPAYLQLTLLTATLAFLIGSILKVKSGKRLKHFSLTYGMSSIILLAAFTYLAKDAYRNILFIYWAIIPFLIPLIVAIIRIPEKKIILYQSVTITSVIIIAWHLIFYVGIVSNKFYKLTYTNQCFGLQVHSAKNPAGAALFMQSKGMQQQKLYTDYLSSSYFLYKLQPDFRSFIDLRDLDIFPDSFFRANTEAIYLYDKFKLLEQTYSLTGAAVLNNQFDKLCKNLYKDSTYALVYADALISVFSKTKSKSSEYADVFRTHPTSISGSFATFINHLFNPWWKPYEPTEAETNDARLTYYKRMGDNQKLLQLLESLKQNNAPLSITALNISGSYYLEQALQDTAGRQEALDSARHYFNLAVNINPANAESHFNYGLYYLNTGNYKKGAMSFAQSAELNHDFLNGHLYAAECYKMLVESGKTAEYLDPLIHHLKLADKMMPNNPNVIWNLGMAYYRKKNCAKAVPLLEQSLFFNELSEEDKLIAKQSIANCK